MPRQITARALAEASTGLEQLGRLQRSIAALQQRARSATAADRETIERHVARQRAQAAKMAAALPSVEELDRARIEWVDATSAEDFGGVLDAEVPLVMLPLRLQTRFVEDKQGVELRIRILPDTIALRTHEPELTPEERALGEDFWAAIETAVDESARMAAWSVLCVSALGAEGGAWIARLTHPDAPEDLLLDRLEAWSRPAVSEVMPERFVARGYRGSTLLFEEVTEAVVPSTLSVGFDPSETGANAADATTIDELIGGLPAHVRWLTDFDEAERQGMALRVRLTVSQANVGIDRLIVTGVRTATDPDGGATLLTELLDAHHYTEGLAVAPRGAPTNNTEDTAAWFSSMPPAAQTYATEMDDALFDVAEAEHASLDGPTLARALGIPQQLLVHVRGSDNTDQREAGWMACALWPATWGYYLREVLADTIPAETASMLRNHWLAYVRGRGPLPPIRTGANPYGILPVTSLTRWQPDATEQGMGKLGDLLRALRNDWLGFSGNAPHVGRTGDATADLYEVMTMQATSCSFATSAVYGEAFTTAWGRYVGAYHSGELPEHLTATQAQVNTLIARLGLDVNARPRLATFLMDEPVPTIDLHLVHGEPGPQPLPDGANYIQWLATATVDDIRQERGVPAGARDTMLYRILRHSVLTAYIEFAKIIKREHGLMAAHLRFEQEFVDVPGTISPGPYSHLDARFVPPGGTKEVRIGDYLSHVDRPWVTRNVRQPPGWLDEFLELRECLQDLATVHSDRLGLLLTETLDCCSHRLDAWITSLATRRLATLRQTNPAGAYIGAYGWVQNLRRRGGPAAGGYVLAPSSSHATAAAMLKSAYLSRDGIDRGTLAIDMSSRRVKEAVWMFETVRNGMPLSALLGYRFERSLHDAPLQLGLEQYLPALREQFPMDDGVLTEPAGATEALAARQVLNGKDLLHEWKRMEGIVAVEPFFRFFENEQLPTVSSPEGVVLIGLLRQLDEIYDAMTDIALAESVFQSGGGSFERAGAVASAMAGDREMPEIEVIQTPRTGVTVRHRVILSTDPVAAGVLAPWPNQRTPRAAACPEVNRWIAAAVGSPAQIGAHARWRRNDAWEEGWVTLANIGVDAIDAIAFEVGETAAEGELEQRIRYFVASQNATRSGIEISFGSPSHWGGAARPHGARTIAETAELWRSLRRTLGDARAARPGDVTAPDSGSSHWLGAQVPAAEARATAALRGLWNAYDTLTGRLNVARTAEADRLARNAAAGNQPAAGDEAPDLAPLNQIRAAAFALGGFGIPRAVIPHEPSPPNNDSEGRRLFWYAIVDDADTARREAGTRLVQLLGIGVDNIDQAAVDAASAGLGQLTQAAAAATLEAITAVNDGVAASVLDTKENARDLAIEAAITRDEEVLRAVFGRGLPVATPFELPAAHPAQASHTGASPNSLGQAGADALQRWMFQLSHVHSTLGELELTRLMSTAVTSSGSFGLSVAQLPFTAGDRWVGADAAAFTPGVVSIMFVGEVRFSDQPNEWFTGFVLAERDDVVPNATETAGLAFEFDQPGAEPPQSVLLAVPGVHAQYGRWTRAQIFEIVEETLELARVRAVDPTVISGYGSSLPALYFTQNFSHDAPTLTLQNWAQSVYLAFDYGQLATTGSDE